MIVFAVAGTRNQLCPSHSTRKAPSSRPSAQAPRTSQPNAFTLSRTRSSASSNAAAQGAEASGSRQTATSSDSASRTRAGKPARSMDVQDADCETAMGPLLWLRFLQKRHPTRLRRAVRPRLRPCNRAAVTKSRPRNPDCHRSAPKAIGNEHKISINQLVTIAIPDLRPIRRCDSALSRNPRSVRPVGSPVAPHRLAPCWRATIQSEIYVHAEAWHRRKVQTGT